MVAAVDAWGGCSWGQQASKDKTWALQKKLPKPPKGLMFRYLEKAKKDGRVLPMSMVNTEGHSANVVEMKADALERKLISMSKGGSNNQRLLTAERKRSLAPGQAAGRQSALPAGGPCLLRLWCADGLVTWSRLVLVLASKSSNPDCQ